MVLNNRKIRRGKVWYSAGFGLVWFGEHKSRLGEARFGTVTVWQALEIRQGECMKCQWQGCEMVGVDILIVIV